MGDKMQQPATEPSQKTPKGYEIPVPKRRDVFAVFKKVAKPKKG
jgi:hypothetical protein